MQSEKFQISFYFGYYVFERNQNPFNRQCRTLPSYGSSTLLKAACELKQSLLRHVSALKENDVAIICPCQLTGEPFVSDVSHLRYHNYCEIQTR